MVVCLAVSLTVLAAVAGIQGNVINLLSGSKSLVIQATTPTTQSLIDAGKGFLNTQNVVAARNSFKQAVELDATSQEAQFLYGLTRILALYEDNQYVQTDALDSIREILELSGVSFSSFGLFDTRGHQSSNTLPATTPRTGDVINYISTRVLPEINGAIANFNAVTSTSFTSALDPSAVLHAYSNTINIDYGDVLVIKALSSLAMCNFELLKVYGLDFSPPQIFNGDPKQLTLYHDLLRNSTQLLTPVNPASLTAAKGGLVSFIDTFKSAATSIQKRQQPAGHAFVLDIPLNDNPVGGTTYQVNKIITAMNEIKASLSAPTYYSFSNDTVLDLSKFFSSTLPINIRQQIVNSSTGAVLSDATIGGMFPLGLSALQTTMLLNADTIRSVAYTGAEKPRLSNNPSSLRFYDNGVFGSYLTSTITLSNIGTADLAIKAMTVKGAYPADFSITPDSCPSLTPTLIPGAACTITAHYTPTTNKSSSSAFIDIASNVDTITIPLQWTLYSQNSLPPTSSTQLIVSRNGNGTGTIEQLFSSYSCGTPSCSYTTSPGDFITLRAIPERYSMLTKWTGCESVNNDECRINPSKNNAVTATFELITTPFSVTVYPATGTYTSPQKVALVANNNVQFRYTVDGSTPTTTSPLYTSPISVGLGTTTVKYIYRASDGTVPLNSAQYTIVNPNAGKPPVISSFNASTSPGSFEVKIVDFSIVNSSIIKDYCVTQNPYSFNCYWSSSIPGYFYMPPVGYGTYPLYAFAKDQFGAISQPFSTSITLVADTAAPVLLDVTPSVGAANVPVDTKLTLSFDEPIQDTSANRIGTSGCVFDGQPDIPCTVNFNSKSKDVTVAFLMPLEFSKTYSALWYFADRSGNTTSVPINFTTAPKPANSTVPNISLELSTNGIISGSGKPLLASGVITAGSASVAYQNISLLITKPDNSITIHPVTTDEKGLYADIPLTLYLNQMGSYKIQAFGGSGSGSMAPNKSSIATVRVLPVAGYAVVVQGRIPSGEGQEAHAKTAARVKSALLARGLDQSNIVSVTSTALNNGKNDIIQALATIAAKMNMAPAPFQLILIDHGEVNKFHLGDDTSVLTPPELAGWLDSMENSLWGSAQKQPRTIVIGSCYSGSFIAALAKEGRTIITSASATEQSFRGPAEPDGVRSGELFLDEFYRGLKRGNSLKGAFNTSVESVRIQSRRGGIVSSSGDKALQNPLVSFAGNQVGVSEIPTGIADDAPDAAYLGTGDNSAYNPLGMLPQDRTAFLESLFFDETTQSATIRTGGSATNSAWFEVRTPSLPLANDGGSTQLIVNLPRVEMTYDQATQTFSGTYDGFSEAGSYDVTIYLQDAPNGDPNGDITRKHITLYRNRAKNNAPQTPELIEPARGATVTTAFLAQWAETQDPDGDAITYTLMVSKQQDMSNPVLVKEGLTLPVDALMYEDGLRDLTTYFWQVWAIDSYGAISKSVINSFTTNNTNGLPSYIKGYITNTSSTSPVSGAILTTGGTSRKSFSNGGFLFAATPGSYNLVATADGFQSKTVGLLALPGKISTQNIALTPLVPESFVITSNVKSAAGSGYLDCPASATKSENITCRLQAGAGYQFASVEGCNGTLSGNTYSAVIAGNCSITADFIPVIPAGTVTYNITAKASVGGSLVCIPATVTESASSTCVVKSMKDFKLLSVTDNSVNVLPLPSGLNFTISGITADHTVSAVYVSAKPGDCSNDGLVTIAEVQSAINMFLGLKPVAGCVDTSGDNVVSIAEVQKTINSFLGL